MFEAAGQALNARVRSLVDLDTAVGYVGIHRYGHLVGRRDVALVLQPGGKGLHKLGDVLAGKAVVERQSFGIRLIDVLFGRMGRLFRNYFTTTEGGAKKSRYPGG